MSRPNFFRLTMAVLIAMSSALSGTSTAMAAAPANDSFSSATLVPGLPFSDTVNNTLAGTEFGESHFCYYSPRTVWYAFTPTSNAVVRVDMAGSSFFDTHLSVYRAIGTSIFDLNFINCTSFGGSVTFAAQAGTTYYFQAGDIFTGGGLLQLNVQEIPPPPNDGFADAAVIPALPFSAAADTTGATFEAGEPTPSCSFSGPPTRTVWYAFTPSENLSLSANIPSASFSTVLAAYTGSSLTGLTQVGCNTFGGWVTFAASAGTTYYFQLGDLFGQGGFAQFNLSLTPPPVADFGFWPSDPSMFDNVQFFSSAWDPVGVGFESQVWHFGDGATGTGCCPTHRYAADGQYTARLIVTTFDGRTASASRAVRVETHDVAITKFAAPQAASAGQTRQIVVSVNNQRYVETVEVQLFKSVPGGFQFVGTLIQTVPVRPSNRTTDFKFTYTFTNSDASLGKVTFKAVALIHGARDALPADNEAIASPTKLQ